MEHCVDSHAHIYLEKMRPDLDDIMARSAEVGIDQIYMPNIDHTSIDHMMEVEDKYPDRCFSMIGLHPCSVNKDFEKELYLVEEWLSKRKFCAIGEMGTDLYWDKTYFEQQKEAFNIQCRWAIEQDLPIVIHCRESINETIEMVESIGNQRLKGVFHCFTGDIEQAEKIIKLGFKLGIGGVATFKNGGLEPVLEATKLEDLLLETDSPYLAPVPYRGKRNEPSYLVHVARKIAEVKGLSYDEVCRVTSQNTKQLFDQNRGIN